MHTTDISTIQQAKASAPSIESRQLTFLESTLSLLLRALPIKNGKHRILDLVSPRPWSQAKSKVRLNYRGKSLRMDANELVGWHFAMLRSFDPEVVSTLLKAARHDEQPVFWDIGANKCVCSHEIAHLLPSAKVIAIEPQRSLRETNLFNLARTCPGRFEYFQVGIGERNEQLELVIPSHNGGGASLHAKNRSTSDRTETVDIVTAKAIADRSKYGWPTLVKIDVEGHELAVVRSLSTALEKKTCKAIVFENYANEVSKFEEIRQIAYRFDYSIYAIKKSLFRTRLMKTTETIAGVTDYLMLAN